MPSQPASIAVQPRAQDGAWPATPVANSGALVPYYAFSEEAAAPNVSTQPVTAASTETTDSTPTESSATEVSFSIDSTIQITPASADLDVGLVQIPGDPSLAATLGAKILTDQRCKSELPGADRLVADLEPAL